VLEGVAPYSAGPLVAPEVQALPPAERRRAGAYTRLAIGVAQAAVAAAGVETGQLASVFASADGDGENLHQICVALASPAPAISPTRFHNSVQNAVSGYWSIAMQSRAPTITVNGDDAVFATALVEAAAQVVCEGRNVLVVTSDLPMPAPLHALHPVSDGAAVALVLEPCARPGALAMLDLRLVPAGAAVASVMNESPLERLRTMNPALRALPLLAALARGNPASVVLELDAAQSLRLHVESCGEVPPEVHEAGG
jgi:hypothetical protein